MEHSLCRVSWYSQIQPSLLPSSLYASSFSCFFCRISELQWYLPGKLRIMSLLRLWPYCVTIKHEVHRFCCLVSWDTIFLFRSDFFLNLILAQADFQLTFLLSLCSSAEIIELYHHAQEHGDKIHFNFSFQKMFTIHGWMLEFAICFLHLVQ